MDSKTQTETTSNTSKIRLLSNSDDKIKKNPKLEPEEEEILFKAMLTSKKLGVKYVEVLEWGASLNTSFVSGSLT